MTPEEIKDKKAFFAQYMGQRVASLHDNVSLVIVGSHPIENIDYLELRSLESITDEDDMAYLKYSSTTEITEFLRKVNETKEFKEYEVIFKGIKGKRTKASFLKCKFSIFNKPTLTVESLDYLRSKGYLIPFRTYTIEDLLQRGWAKIRKK